MDVQKLNLAEMESELRNISAEKKALSKIENSINVEIIRRYGEQLHTMLLTKDEPFGVVKLESENCLLEVTYSKKVEWDQDKLKELISEIGPSYSEYISEKYSVSETKYKNWPSVIQKQFQPARTVSTDKPKIKIERKNDEQ